MGVCDNEGIPKPIILFVGVGLPVGMLIASNGTAYLEPAMMGGLLAGVAAVGVYEAYQINKKGLVGWGVSGIGSSAKSLICSLP